MIAILNHSRLTPKQAEDTRLLYAELIRKSRERHAFGRLCRSIGYDPGAVKELWEARLRLGGHP